MIFTNFKTFGQEAGESVPNLVKVVEEVSSLSGIEIFSVVQIINSALGDWVQHLGSSPEELPKDGIKGVFLNHSDHKYESWEELVNGKNLADDFGLKTQIFADNLEELKKVLSLKPTFVAFEPPELIGNTETSVSQAKPEAIREAVVLSEETGIPLIVGAGIKSKEDVIKSLELGAVGVAVSSAVVKAKNPRAVLLELTEGFK